MAEDSLDRLYAQHVQTLMRRADHALAGAGFDALVVMAGAPLVQFLDDQEDVYKRQPWRRCAGRGT